MRKFNTVFLYNTKGDVTVYNVREEAFKALGNGFITFSVGTQLRIQGKEFNSILHPKFKRESSEFFHERYPDSRQRHYADYILVNEYGEVLGIEDFEDVIIADRKKNDDRKMFCNHRVLGTWNGTGPVPGTGGWGNGHYFRRPKTLQALKKACGVCKEDGEPTMRGNRTKAKVPTSWSDIPRSDQNNRNWKKYRKEQWKQKKDTSRNAGVF